ncbi:MAG: HugZ family pyridoxamine 5'-phosphate oxidase [Alphaproteobacteria bacterium]
MTEPTPAQNSPGHIRACDRATLSTSQAGTTGWPYGSLVLTMADHDASPVLLLSDLAEHSKNLAVDNRLSLLFDNTAGLDDPLTGARVTVLGTAEETTDPRLRARYIARHPSAEGYAGFADFRFYFIRVTRAHLVAGFGVIHWIDATGLLWHGESAALMAHESDIVDHMNTDHADALDLYANRLLNLPGTGWRMTGIDPEGCDLRHGGRVARLPFQSPVHDADTARQALVAAVQLARSNSVDM